MLLHTTGNIASPLYIRSNTRLESIDMLRGIALFGVFITHFICQFYGLAFPQSTIPAVVVTPVDSFLDKILPYLLFDKARGMFSFLFGVGFYFQLISASKAGMSFKSRFIKRFAILLVFGLLHYYFLFKGDVLRYYAILGIVLLLCYKLKPKILLIASVVLAVVIPAICTAFENDLFIGSFNTPVFITIFGHFLFGFWVAQKRILENISAYRLELKRVFMYSLSANIFLFLIRGGIKTAAAKSLIVISPTLDNINGITFLIGNQAMLLVFLSGIPLLYLNKWWRSKLTVFVIPGRMTLTNYLAQSVIAIALYKVGIYALLGTGAAFVTSILLCVFQLWVSRWWLAHFTTGPFEWLWRSATNFKWQRAEKPVRKMEPREAMNTEPAHFLEASFRRVQAFK